MVTARADLRRLDPDAAAALWRRSRKTLFRKLGVASRAELAAKVSAVR